MSTTSTAQIQSATYWRKSNVKYTLNEVYCDIAEDLDGIIDKQGNILSLEIHGTVRPLMK